MQERALRARDLYIKNPKNSQIDDDLLVCPKCHCKLDKKLYDPKWTI